MIITTVASVQYACEISEEDAEKIRAKAGDGDMIDAVWELYNAGQIRLYRNSTETDFWTESIIEVDD